MDYIGTIQIPWTPIKWILVLAALAGLVAYIYLQYMPILTANIALQNKEGFYGGAARGTGHPDCLRELNEAAEVLSYVMGAQGTADYDEFQLILSKLACLKKDIMSPSGIVNATRYQPYATSHDREPVAEVAATCLNRTIPRRDLDIVFKTWFDRGQVLLKRLCTVVNLKEKEVQRCEALFASAHGDVYNVAIGRCIITPGEQEAAAHDAQPNDDPMLVNQREYKGYFSGFGGQI
jgi:hypothetical protein